MTTSEPTPEATVRPSLTWPESISGTFTEPLATFAELKQELADNHRSPKVFLALVIVPSVAFILGAIKLSPDSLLASSIECYLEISNTLINWMLFSICMMTLSRFAKDANLSFGEAITACAYPFLPLILLAPISCLRTAAGPVYFLVAALPIIWFLILELLAFKKFLGLSKLETVVMAMILPPVLFFTYLFWVCTTVLALASAMSS